MENVPAIAKKLIPRKFPLEYELISIFKECTPKILVVTDGLTFDSAQFGLLDFVDTLKNTTIHGMTPIVETELKSGFTFTDSTFGISKFDVLFLFGVESSGALPAAEVEVISRFMEAGGGVFGTGDHAQLGRALCSDIPRIRGMRHWKNPDVPSGSGTDRLTTNLPGSDDAYQFEDQSDSIPQRLYPRYYEASSGLPADSKPHYLLQHPTKNIIEVFPDHPHEGECVVPTVLNGQTPNGEPEWPTDGAGQQVVPELVAMTMSAGGGFDFVFGPKQPVIPRSFGAIAAYDGHLADVGRVTTDATWHHFINVNLVSTSDGPGLNSDALERVHTYFRNTAEWLMPKKTRRCLRFPILLEVLERFAAMETFKSLEVSPLEDARAAMELGDEVVRSLRPYMHPAAIRELEQDVLELFDENFAAALRPRPEHDFVRRLGRRQLPREVFTRAALGVAAASIAEALPAGPEREKAFRSGGELIGLEKRIGTAVSRTMKDVAGLVRETRQTVDEICALAK